MSALVDRYLGWVQEVMGASVTAVVSAGAGASRSTWLVDLEDAVGGRKEVVLRVDTGDGPLSGTEISLRREGAVYQALQGKGVPLATIEGVSEDGLALILGRLDGSADWNALLDDAERAAICHEFADSLAKLHTLDAAALQIPGMRMPRSRTEAATNELDAWEAILNARVHRPTPVVRFAFDWMRRHAPACDETVLCHGDPGPGNFMHRGGRLTGLIDWEFAHYGDPLDDIGWMAFRGRGGGMAAWPLEAIFRRYSEVSGRELDRRRIEFYQLFTMLRMAVCCLVAMDNRKGGMNVNVHFLLYPSLEILMPLAIASMSGFGVPELKQAEDFDDELALYVEQEFLPSVASEISDPILRARLLSGLPVVAHLRARLSVGAEVDRACFGVIERETGARFDDWRAAEQGLEEMVKAGSVDDERWTSLFTEVGAQRVRLWPGTATRMTIPTLPDWLG